MVTKRAVVELLTRDELLEVVDRFELRPPDRVRKDGLVDTVSASKKTPLAEALANLSRDRLKALCHSLGVDDTGREKTVLIERLTGGSKHGVAGAPAVGAGTMKEATLNRPGIPGGSKS